MLDQMKPCESIRPSRNFVMHSLLNRMKTGTTTTICARKAFSERVHAVYAGGDTLGRPTISFGTDVVPRSS